MTMQVRTIAVDVDGVLAEQVVPVLQKIKEKYGIRLSKEQITEWDYRIGDTDIKTEIELAEMEESFVKSMLPIEGCHQALERLASIFQVVVATSRHPVTDAWTKEWLETTGIKYDRFVNTHKEGKGLLGVQVLVDDYIGNIEEFATSGSDSRHAILFSQPWNKDYHSLKPFVSAKRVYIAADWKEAIRLIDSISHSLPAQLCDSPDTE